VEKARREEAGGESEGVESMIAREERGPRAATNPRSRRARTDSEPSRNNNNGQPPNQKRTLQQTRLTVDARRSRCLVEEGSRGKRSRVVCQCRRIVVVAVLAVVMLMMMIVRYKTGRGRTPQVAREFGKQWSRDRLGDVTNRKWARSYRNRNRRPRRRGNVTGEREGGRCTGDAGERKGAG
jgi:hypothetical protein